MTDVLAATFMIPLISGRVRGVAGIAHLPRLWLKMRLHALGRLPPGYRFGEGGSDGALIEAFGVDLPAMLAFVQAEAPDEQRFEAWIHKHATTCAAPDIEAHNERIETGLIPEPRRSEWTTRFDVPGYTIAARLNELDDWDLLHAQLGASREAAAIVPAVSSSVMGPRGIAHLARLWVKKLLRYHGRLPDGYRCGEGGFDGWLLDDLGIANADVDEFFQAERPGYLTFEKWVAAHMRATADDIATMNEEMLTYEMPDRLAVPRRAQYGLTEDVRLGVVLNDIDDWGGLHEQLLALH